MKFTQHMQVLEQTMKKEKSNYYVFLDCRDVELKDGLREIKVATQLCLMSEDADNGVLFCEYLSEDTDLYLIKLVQLLSDKTVVLFNEYKNSEFITFLLYDKDFYKTMGLKPIKKVIGIKPMLDTRFDKVQSKEFKKKAEILKYLDRDFYLYNRLRDKPYEAFDNCHIIKTYWLNHEPLLMKFKRFLRG